MLAKVAFQAWQIFGFQPQRYICGSSEWTGDVIVCKLLLDRLMTPLFYMEISKIEGSNGYNIAALVGKLVWLLAFVT